jgi:hypothetical protein
VPGVQFSIGAVQQNQNQTYVNGSSGPGTPTNSKGEFRVEGISPGRYVFIINNPPFFNPAGTTAPKVYSDPAPFEVLDGDVSDLEIKARRGLSISGVLVPDGITDRAILDRLSKLVIFASVDPGPNAIHTYNNSSTAQINPDWGFQVEGLQPGKARLNIGSFNSPSIGFQASRIELNGIVQKVIELAPGQNISGVKIYVTYGTGVVRGQIKVDGGTLPNDTFLFVNLAHQGDDVRYGAQVDSRGNFLIKGIQAGTYDAVMQINSMGSLVLPRGVPRMQRQTITVTEGAETQVIFTLDLTGKEEP